MHSPLPDSSALEAGLVEDSRATRFSRVQDNVRNLLGSSIISSVRTSFIRSPPLHQVSIEHEPRSPVPSPFDVHGRTANPPSSASGSLASTLDDDLEHGLCPPTSYQQQVQHQSTLFNTRAIAALVHPDLTDPSLAVLLQQKTEDRHRRAWKRSRNRKLRHASARRSTCSIVLCIVAGVLLAGIVATYLTVATSEPVSTTFHILFILGILFATIVFVHAVVRICLFKSDKHASPRLYAVPDGRLKRRRRHRHHRDHAQLHERQLPSFSDSSDDFRPATPIPVHFAADEVRPDSREAEPSAGADRASRIMLDIRHEVDAGMPKPPPAYGRWRGSVRADPELLHWQAVPSPTDPDMPPMPSPTYEEAMAVGEDGRSGPPSYVTRESPARRRDAQEELARVKSARAQTVEPEMVEVRGIDGES
ncbi:hypothetical protein LTR62_003095 [Meristemomyces frigidus]|uniref:Uncharacterized protein n=1 Tax=Meristemomyces frigidus TaxID=1508187 RepID=A0AAN7TJ53_9PEZI|nr:hypothetical protein LTR62_003095 [Meristemomyces frigidus]